jgi:copper chaperone CopZ
MLIQMEVGGIDGVEAVVSDHRTGITEVTYDDSVLGPEQIVEAIVKAGYGAEPAGD